MINYGEPSQPKPEMELPNEMLSLINRTEEHKSQRETTKELSAPIFQL